MKFRLTGPQASALECRGVEHGTDPGEKLLARCWREDFIVFEESERRALVSAVIEEANAEDATAEDRNETAHARRIARGARKALSNLADKVSRHREATLQHTARRIGDPRIRPPIACTPRLECEGCGIGVYLSAKAFEDHDGGPVFCSQCCTKD